MEVDHLRVTKKHTKFQVDISNSFWDIPVLIFCENANLFKRRNLAIIWDDKTMKTKGSMS